MDSIIDPVSGRLFFDDPEPYKVIQFSLHRPKGKAGLEHDFPLIETLSRKSVEKTKDPGSCDRSKEFV